MSHTREATAVEAFAGEATAGEAFAMDAFAMDAFAAKAFAGESAAGEAVAVEPVAAVPGAGVAGRRTVTIQGRGAERYTPTTQRRRPTRRPHEREGFRPDRVAMWAVMLGFILVLVAATSSHAAAISHGARLAPRAGTIHHRTALVRSAAPRHARAASGGLRIR